MLRPSLWSRRRVKAIVAAALRHSYVDGFGFRLRRHLPLVVGYHRVVESFDRAATRAMPGMLVSRSMLERHLDEIGRRHTFVSLDDLAVLLQQGRRPARPVAAVTFDDGYRDVYENAWPLLRRKGIPAAVFLVVDVVGTDRLLLHDELHLLLSRAAEMWSRPVDTLIDELYALDTSDPLCGQCARACRAAGADTSKWTVAFLRTLSQCQLQSLMRWIEAHLGPSRLEDDCMKMMTWPMVAEMQAAGVVVGSHTASHALLAREPANRLSIETAGSKRQLEARLHAPVHHFAYPDGSFDSASVRAVASAGFRFGYTTCTHRDRTYPLLTIPRRLLWEHSSVDAAGCFSPAILDCQIQGVLGGARACNAQTHA